MQSKYWQKLHFLGQQDLVHPLQHGDSVLEVSANICVTIDCYSRALLTKNQHIYKKDNQLYTSFD